MSATILVGGTWSLENGDVDSLDLHVAANEFDALPWWHPLSTFGQEATAHGVQLAAEPFVWSTELDGLRGKNWGWWAAGQALRYFAHGEYPPVVINIHGDQPAQRVNVIAHSHGGQVAIYAAAQGLLIDTLVTVASPVRRDLRRFRKAARVNIRRWIHIYSPNDPVQLEGCIGDGSGPFEWQRDVSKADQNVEEPTEEPNAHSKLHEPALWTARGWWAWVADNSNAAIQPPVDTST